jgi:hypothetical protein
MDAYTAELARHGLEQVEREVQWLESVIDTERGTRGALDYRSLPLDRDGGPRSAASHPGSDRAPASPNPGTTTGNPTSADTSGVVHKTDGTTAVPRTGGSSAVLHRKRGGSAAGASAFIDVPPPTKEQA